MYKNNPDYVRARARRGQQNSQRQTIVNGFSASFSEFFAANKGGPGQMRANAKQAAPLMSVFHSR
jgi:hypothetical protein